MDDSEMKKKLLVVGDSFMHPDSDYPGQHWSEMLPEYNILMFAESGASNGIIANNFYQGIKLNPDAVVLGFSDPARLEFALDGTWITGAHQNLLTTDQKLTVDLVNIHTCEIMSLIKSCSIARSLLATCELKNITYAWTLNLLFDNRSVEPFPTNSVVNDILDDFAPRRTPTTLSMYRWNKHSPGFHVDDPEWQIRYTAEIRTILQTPLT